MSVATMRRYNFPTSIRNERLWKQRILAGDDERPTHVQDDQGRRLHRFDASSDVGRQVGREEYQADGHLVHQRNVDEGNEIGNDSEEATGGTWEDEEGQLLPRAGGAPRLFEGVTERKHLDEEDDEKTERTGHQLVQRRAEKLGGLESNVCLEREVFAHPRAHHQRAGVASDLHFFRGVVGVGRAVQRALGRGAELRVRDRVRVRAPLRGLSAELPAQASLAERGGEGFARVEPMDEGGLSDGGEHAVTPSPGEFATPERDATEAMARCHCSREEGYSAEVPSEPDVGSMAGDTIGCAQARVTPV